MKTINQLNSIDKPRERLLKYGSKSLRNYELIAVLLGSGIKGKDIIKLSKEIENLFDKNFDKLDLKSLLSIYGLGKAKASQLISAVELSKRYLQINENKKITSSKDIYEELKEYANKKQEYFLCLYLDGANNLIEKRVISIGTLNSSLVHPREVYSPAIELRAASIIVAHNHPSGQLFASSEDDIVTNRLLRSGKLLGIDFLDHILITKNGYISIF